ncbi:MAG: amidohydrolase family protein [Thermomicrobiales bacterium]
MVALQRLIDTDIHNGIDRKRLLSFLPEPWATRFATGRGAPGGLGYWNPNGVLRSDAVTPDGERIDGNPKHLGKYFLDVHNVEYGILNPQSSLQYGLSPEPDFAAAVVSALNDVLMNDWLEADPRLRASAVISPADPLLAAKEIHRVAQHPGVVQILMGSGARAPYGNRIYDPIYQAASEHNLPVAIHPGSEGVGVSGPPTAVGYPSSYLEWHTNLVGSYMSHLISLVTEGTFVKFPNLRFVLLEGGIAWLPAILWRLDKNWKGLRQTVPWLDRLPSEYVFEHIRISTQPMEEPDKPEHFKAILDMFPADKMLMFSSDYPHWDGDTPDFAARAFPRELRSRVMSETARELYRLPAPVAANAVSEVAADD